MIILFNKFGVFTQFLYKIQQYFSCKVCLHFIVNQYGKVICDKIDTIIVCTPIVISFPAMAGFAFQESQISKLCNSTNAEP